MSPEQHGANGPHEELRPRSLVRPYMLTRGRTVSAAGSFELHAPVLALAAPEQLLRSATPETRRIVELCQTPLSIAELSARLHVPIGVVRVLVGDLAESQLVTVRAAATPADHRDVRLLERLLEGIRAL